MALCNNINHLIRKTQHRTLVLRALQQVAYQPRLVTRQSLLVVSSRRSTRVISSCSQINFRALSPSRQSRFVRAAATLLMELQLVRPEKVTNCRVFLRQVDLKG